MAQCVPDKYLLVVAIDFGTTYSGYAFSNRDDFEKDPLKIYANQAWSAERRQLLSLKTPTCVLLDSDRNLISFGYEAENKYAELVEDDEYHGYYYFHRFKMALFHNKEITRELLIEDITGKTVLALDVFSMSIKFIKNKAMETIQKQLIGVKIDDIRWVLTVPAIWRENAKQFMRISADKAGISGDKLYIALEPEAAAIYCQNLPYEKLKSSAKGLAAAATGTKYMVVDLGGGTADITVHEKIDDKRLKEIYRATGSNCGGVSVDGEFLTMLAKILGDEVMDAFKKDDLEQYLDLLREFENRKRSIKPENSKTINLLIPFTTINDLCKKYLCKNFQDVIEKSMFRDVLSIRKDKLKVDADIFIGLFQPTIDAILQLISDVLMHKNTVEVSQLILVGGFSECPLVQKAVETKFPNHQVIIPIDSELAVLKGATIFGHRPHVITERIARYTYGFGKIKIFDPEKHDKSHLDISPDGRRKAIHVFDTIIRKNEVVPVLERKKSTAKLRPGNNGLFTLKLYQSEKEDPMYTDEEGCSIVGTVTLEKTDPTSWASVTVEYIFGETELGVIVVESISGKVSNIVKSIIEMI